MVQLEQVFEAYYDCRKNKRRTCNALKFEVNYEVECVKLWKDINNRTYEIGKSICFIVTKPTKREVFAANFKDRVVHHLVIKKLEPLFEEYFIFDNYNCRKEKGTLFGIKRLQGLVQHYTENFTKPAYIAKFDLQGFFMSIHKPTLWKMLEKFITERYFGEDKEDILYLVEKIVLHNPELHCIRKSPKYMWDDLPKNKSLFTVGKDYGLPIGNLTSQMFANFYLTEFDLIMWKKYKGYYGRYVDDFFVIHKDKDFILKSVSGMRKWLKDNLSVNLHPKKLYIQPYQKGCKFVGSVIKGSLLYPSNRTVSNFIKAIHRFNKIADEKDENVYLHVQDFLSCMNSYFGYFRQFNAYAIRRKYYKMISPKWFKVVYIQGHFEKFVCKNRYNRSKIVKNLIKETKYFNND